jgi:histone deacetylase 6
MGFCIFNNVAVAAKELQRLGLAKKILIVDWDVHHGNCTQEIFVDDRDVLFISIHRHDNGAFYPSGVGGSPAFVGKEPAKGFSVNIGWDGPGATDADYMAAFMQVVMPIAMEFCPDFVFVSAGFDAAIGDPIGECCVSPYGFSQMTHQLLSLASGNVLLVLEGGYNVPMISNCSVACLQTLLGDPVPLSKSEGFVPSENAMRAIKATIKAQSRYWKSLRPRNYAIKKETNGYTPLQRVLDVFWGYVCLKSFNMIPLPMHDPRLRKYFKDRIFMTDNVLEKTKGIVVFAHER